MIRAALLDDWPTGLVRAQSSAQISRNDWSGKMPNKVFNDVKLSWKGREFTVVADDVLKTIAKVEDVVCASQLFKSIEAMHLPYAKLAHAYGILLRAAGARDFEDDEIYASMLGKGDGGVTAAHVVNALQTLMIPPEHMQDVVKKDD